MADMQDSQPHDRPRAGNFEARLWGPYPCQIELFYRGEIVARFTHRELRDLEYVIHRARDVAREKLGKDFREA